MFSLEKFKPAKNFYVCPFIDWWEYITVRIQDMRFWGEINQI